ncbi:MAG: sugar phosphate isomerase/epimerase [Nitrospirae bacterium]|nr:sugar phosphate isomerase/epimerase [Nitrospirota bacterium]
MADIKIGNQTAFSAQQQGLPFDFAISNSFDAFEWFSDKKSGGQGWAIEDAGKKTRCNIRAKSLMRGIALSVHVPAEANPLMIGSLDVFINHVEFAYDVGASLLNIHLFTEYGIEPYLKSLIPIIKLTAKAKIKLSIENTIITGPDDFNQLFYMIKKLKGTPTKHIGMCLDIGHANIYHETRNNFLGYIDRLSNDVPIIHIHAHENFGDRDSHLTLFTGPSGTNNLGLKGFVARMVNRGFSGLIILEQWPTPPELLIAARMGLLDLFNNYIKE